MYIGVLPSSQQSALLSKSWGKTKIRQRFVGGHFALELSTGLAVSYAGESLDEWPPAAAIFRSGYERIALAAAVTAGIVACPPFLPRLDYDP
jgi:hypothetical protein